MLAGLFLGQVPVLRLCPQFLLRLGDGTFRVIQRIVFLSATEFRELADDLFGSYATRKGPFGEGPIAFGLAQLGARKRRTLCVLEIVVARGILRIEMQFEIPEVVGSDDVWRAST